MSRLMTKPTKWHVRPAKTHISLGIRPVWSESSLSAWRKLGSIATHWAHSENSVQTGRMPRLIWVFAGRTVIFFGFVIGWLKFSFLHTFFRQLHLGLNMRCFINFTLNYLHFHCNRLRWNQHSCCTSFLDAKHLPVMWSRPRRGAEQRQRQPVTFFVYWRLLGVGHVSPWR